MIIQYQQIQTFRFSKPLKARVAAAPLSAHAKVCRLLAPLDVEVLGVEDGKLHIGKRYSSLVNTNELARQIISLLDSAPQEITEALRKSEITAIAIERLRPLRLGDKIKDIFKVWCLNKIEVAQRRLEALTNIGPLNPCTRPPLPSASRGDLDKKI